MISQAAFTRLSVQLINNFTWCRNSGIDDLDVNACLRRLGTKIGNSMDENGGLRFLPNTMATFHNGSRIDVFQKAAKYTLQKVKSFCLVFLLCYYIIINLNIFSGIQLL